MHTATSWSRLSRISVIVLVLAFSPPATFAQDRSEYCGRTACDETLPAIREFSIRDLSRMSPKVGEAFYEATLALNTGRFAAARKKMGELQLDRLSAYERGKVERVLFNAAYAEEDFTAAHQHLVNALESGGLNEPETAAAQEQIRRINARLATAPE
jgi:hypothetical protein